FLSLYYSGRHPVLPSFPTRRSSDLCPPLSWSIHAPAYVAVALRSSLPASSCPTCCRLSRRSASRSLTPYVCRRYATEPRTCAGRSEEHTSELQSRGHLVCRLLLEKK